jgi:hypothetical protein
MIVLGLPPNCVMWLVGQSTSHEGFDCNLVSVVVCGVGVYRLETEMMATREEVNDFASFALAQLERGNATLSIDELYDLWRREHPDPADHSENVAAVRGAIDDFKSGDRGRPAGQLSRELREEFDKAAGQ